MAEGNITLSKKSLNRLPVIRDLEQGHIRQAEAAKQLRLSVRQIRRLLTRYLLSGLGPNKRLGILIVILNKSINLSLKICNGCKYTSTNLLLRDQPKESLNQIQP